MGSHVHENKVKAPVRPRTFMDRQDGRINFVAILLLLLAAAAVYSAVIFGPVYMEKSKLRAKVEAVANMAHRNKNVEELRKELYREAKTLGLDLHPQQFKIEMDPQERWITFEVDYVREVDLVPFGETVELEFSIFHEEVLQK